MLTRLASRYLFFPRPVLNFVNSAHARTFKNDAHREEVKNLLIKDYPNVEIVSLPPGTPVFCFWTSGPYKPELHKLGLYKPGHYKLAVPITTNLNPANFIKEHRNKPEFLATSTINTQTPSECLKVTEDTLYVYFGDLGRHREPSQEVLEAIDFNTKNKLTKSS
jgi:hypothetical protein